MSHATPTRNLQSIRLERLAELLAETKETNRTQKRLFSQPTATEIDHDHQNQDPPQAPTGRGMSG